MLTLLLPPMLPLVLLCLCLAASASAYVQEESEATDIFTGEVYAIYKRGVVHAKKGADDFRDFEFLAHVEVDQVERTEEEAPLRPGAMVFVRWWTVWRRPDDWDGPSGEVFPPKELYRYRLATIRDGPAFDLLHPSGVTELAAPPHEKHELPAHGVELVGHDDL